MTKRRSVRLALLACACMASLGLIAGPSPAAAKTKKVVRTFRQCQPVGLPLGDHSSVQALFTVPKVPKRAKPVGGRVLSVDLVALRITHTFDGDVTAYLVSPSGVVDALTIGRGGSADDFGSGAPDCTGTPTTFSDIGPTAIADGTAPFAGAFRPESPLSVFSGGSASGIWRIVVSDGATGDTGTLHAASLSVTYKYKLKRKHK